MLIDNLISGANRDNFVDKTIEYLNQKFSQMGYELVNVQLTTETEELTEQQLNRFEAIDFAGRVYTEQNDDGTFTHTFMPETEDYEILSFNDFDN
jgi:predicted site-specific integrase-resolvase